MPIVVGEAANPFAAEEELPSFGKDKKKPGGGLAKGCVSAGQDYAG
jgi:hypothetical protein